MALHCDTAVHPPVVVVDAQSDLADLDVREGQLAVVVNDRSLCYFHGQHTTETPNGWAIAARVPTN